MSIAEIPLFERPRERCLQQGPRCLSLREILALILGSGPRDLGCMGLAQRILNQPGNGLADSEQERAFFTAMEVSGNAHLKNIWGLGPTGQARILAAFEIGRRYSLFREHSKRPPQLKQSVPDLASKALKLIPLSYRNEPQEWLGFIPLHPSGKLGELCIVEKGVRTHVNIDPVELFARVLALRPSGIFLFHNHPSGNCQPSVQDLDLTQRVQSTSRQLGIHLLGHWIVAPQSERWIDPQIRLGRMKAPVL